MMKRRTIDVSLVTVTVLAAAAGACSQATASSTNESFPAASGAVDAGFAARVVRPAFGPTVTATVAPPSISGGTLRMLADGVTAVVSDPDRDAIYVVDTTGVRSPKTIDLRAGDEPGRLVEDGAGRVHAALRGGGALVTIDPVAGSVLARRTACPAPRGVDWDPTSDVVWIACATGELLALPAAGGAATASWTLERDLRDVLVDSDGSLIVTTFRAAEVLRVGTDGAVRRRDHLRTPEPGFEAHVAWRCIHGSSGAVVVVHQAETAQSIPTDVPNAYGSSFGEDPGSVVQSVVSVVAADGSTTAGVLVDGVLPVDIALSPDAQSVAVAVPGSAFLLAEKRSPVVFFGFGGARTIPFSRPLSISPEVPPQADASAGPAIRVAEPLLTTISNQAIAVAFDGAGELVVQTREPAQLVLVSTSGSVIRTIPLAPGSRADSGHDIFHTAATAQIACASCHPEGGDDGFVWTLDAKRRRTPSLRGTIQGTAPYHWPGDEADFAALTDDVYSKRMGGGPLDNGQMGALKGWVESIPAPPMPSWVDVSAAHRGLGIFNRSDTACASCHSGAKFTNNATVDIGTGGAFQVPPLVGIGWRSPFLHDGCAKTLADRFAADGGCDTAGHGQTSQLSPGDLDDLIAYLQTL